MRHVPSKVALHLQSKFLCKPWIEELGISGISPNLKYCQVSGCLVISRDQAGRANLRRAELHRITMNYTIRDEKQPKNNKKQTTGLAPQPRGRKSAQYCPSSRICKLSSRRCFGHFISSSFILSKASDFTHPLGKSSQLSMISIKRKRPSDLIVNSFRSVTASVVPRISASSLPSATSI